MEKLWAVSLEYEPKEIFLLITRCLSDLSAALLVKGIYGKERQVKYLGIFLDKVSFTLWTGLGSESEYLESFFSLLVKYFNLDLGLVVFKVFCNSLKILLISR